MSRIRISSYTILSIKSVSMTMGPALVEAHCTGAENLQREAVRYRQGGGQITGYPGINGNRYHIAGGLIVFCMLYNRVQHQIVFKIDRITSVFPA